jgi:hypothetical protein
MPFDAKSVSDYVRNCIQNEIAPHDEVFSPRF